MWGGERGVWLPDSAGGGAGPSGDLRPAVQGGGAVCRPHWAESGPVPAGGEDRLQELLNLHLRQAEKEEEEETENEETW